MSGQGYDTVPMGEDPDDRMWVNVLVGFSEAQGSEGEPIYERHRLNRPANYRFEEPLDMSTPEPDRRKMLPELERFRSERERRKTFDGKWTTEYHVTPQALAKDGFIYKGPGDRVMCVFCSKSIRKWERQDTVSGEHKRLYPHCPWVRGKANDLNKPISETERVKQDIGVLRKGLPQNTDMNTKEARLQTFKRWPVKRKFTSAMLVSAGFFHDEDNDILTCFHCGLKVPGWEENIFQRHDQSFPNCPMVQHGQTNGQSNTLPEVELASANSASHDFEASSAGAQCSAVNIEADMNSPAFRAVLEDGDFAMEDIIRAVETIRISKGSGPITSMDIMRKLYEDDDNDMDF